MKTMIFRIGDIHCIGCLNRITYALKQLDAIDIDIQLDTKIAKVMIKDDLIKADELLLAIKQAGYDAEWLTTISDENDM